MTAASTILGAILFLRFGYAVGETGFLGALGIILLGHLITIPTALAIAERCTTLVGLISSNTKEIIEEDDWLVK